jgi:hypothetical protein
LGLVYRTIHFIWMLTAMGLQTQLQDIASVLLLLLPGGLWVAWCLWCVNWKKAWPVLSQGAWTGVVLLMLIAALVWAEIEPGPYPLFDERVIPNFWWQLLCVATISALGLFCGWLQGLLGWTPMEVALEPAAGHSPNHGNVDHHGYDDIAEMSQGHSQGH